MSLDTNALFAKLGKEVWLIGKGPSIDKYDWSKITLPTVCVNESAFICPSPTCAIAIDYEVLDKFYSLQDQHPSCIILRRMAHVQYRFDPEYIWEHKTHASITWQGTGPVATQVLSKIGVTKIHALGFDSIDGNITYSVEAKDIQAVCGNKDGFKRVNNAFKEVLEKLPIEIIWEHRYV